MNDDGRYLFVHTCVESTCDDIGAMVEQARDVSMRTFRRKIGAKQYRWLEGNLGYDRLGLRLAKDWSVSAYRSVYRGVPAYYLRWSAIEHIFTLDGVLGPSVGDPISSHPWPVRGSPVGRKPLAGGWGQP